MQSLTMILIRPATNDDKANVARVHVRSWQVGYRDLLPSDYLDQLDPRVREAHYTFEEDDPTSPRTIVAVEYGSVLGFATFGVSRDADSANKGEVLALYVDPDSWGQGVGRTLISSARTHLREMSFTAASLWVLYGNQRAMHFYETDGWSPDGSTREDEVWGVKASEVRYRRTLT